MEEKEEWKLFSRQEEALQYIAEAGPDYRIFSREMEVGGSRVHQVYPSCRHFSRAYQQYDTEYKTFYEVIPIGHPAKLYFDLEFPTALNPDHNGPKMVETFLVEVKTALERDFDRTFSMENVIKLDATTPEKFSHHIVFPEVVFRHLVHTKIFVERLCQYVDQRLESEDGTLLSTLKVNNGRNSELFVDRSVYGKKQNFRIFQSRKFGKFHPFQRAAGELADKTDEDVLLSSLITNVDADGSKSFLEYPETGEFLAFLSNHKQTKAYTRTSGYGKTPFPSVDTFFNGILRETGRDCWIGKWEFESGSQTMRLFVDGDSNCCEGTVEGQQDNTCKTLIVAFFKSKTYFVKCPGKECGSKRPELKPLPDLESLPIVTSTVPPHD